VAIQHERAGGSGFIVSPDGYIMTNGHVVKGDIEAEEDPKAVARRITVILSNEKRYKARVIGHCLDPDVALVKIEAEEPLAVVTLGDSDNVRAGQRSYAYGMPTGLKRTLTAGIVSNVERTDLGTFTKVIQTDAAINPGNSGGPLFSESGEVLGLNTYSRGGEGLGFTIPINVAVILKEHFLKDGRFRRAALPFFVTRRVSDEFASALGVSEGVFVDHVEADSSAAQAGLAAGDVIVEMNGRPVCAKTEAAHKDFVWKLVTLPIGSSIKFKVLRKKEGEFEELAIEGTLVEDEPAVEHRWQTGEIKELRYDDIGLGVKPVTALTRYVYNLPNRPGVWVTTLASNSPAWKADIRWGDLITAIDDVELSGLEQFRDELEKQLATCCEYVRMTVVRGNDVLKTALKPYYDLKGKKIALVVPPKDCEHLELTRKFLVTNGCPPLVVSTAVEPSIDGEKKARADMLLKQMDAAAVDAVLLLGGKGAEVFWESEELLAVVKTLVAGKKAVGAAGAAAVVLANAEPALAEKKMTTDVDYSRYLLDKGMKFTGKDVERDGPIVTTSGIDKRVMKAFLAQFRAAVLGARE
jgi:serine protease Do